MRTVIKSLNNGHDIVDSRWVTSLKEGIESVRTPFRRRSATSLRQRISEMLRAQGWSDQVRVSAKIRLTVTAKRGRTALCLQTGNMARFYADLLKLQALFYDGKIDAAIYIVPTKAAARTLGSNLAHFDRMTSELESVFHKVVTVPLIVIGFDE